MEDAAARPSVLGFVLGWISVAVLTVLAVGLVVVGLVMPGSKMMEASSQDEQRDAMIQAASQVAMNMMTLDHKQIQKDIDRVLTGATGTFKDQFASQSKGFIEQVTKTQATSKAHVLSAGVTSMDDDSGEVIVAVSATVTSPSVPTGTPRNMRFQFDMSKVDGQWKASKFGMIS